jgi:NAD(P)-dependent dehydrogenase (short-subunit alcohol dehydrogenase family)
MEEKKNIVVTGGNRGVGLETVKALYEDGHNIIFGSRSERDNEDAIKFILAEAPQSTGSVKCFQLDLSQKASIEEFSRQVKE